MIKDKLHRFIQNKLSCRDFFSTYNFAYEGKIYNPIYNPNLALELDRPKIYNQFGKEMDTWFIRDFHSAHCPHRITSKYFLWDRFDIGLETHFYTHEAMLQTMGTPKRRYGLFVESESIVPSSYSIFKNRPTLHKDFDAIFTYSEDHLNTISNAKLFVSCATVWYGNEKGSNVTLSPNQYKEKTKNISMICSNKVMTYFHSVRHRFAFNSLQSGKVDIFGTFNGGAYLEFKSDSLRDYRFQIVVENDISAYYFTEKILDCFVSMTVPIYLGATRISDFFNSEGIIFISEKDSDNINKIVGRCDEKLYEDMLPAIIDNYNKALRYLNVYDRLYEDYFKISDVL